MRRWLLIGALFCGPFFGAGTVDVAEACPMCRQANETDDRLPRAYMYSILFMLSVPAMLVTGFGVGFYRLSRQRPENRQS